MAVIGDREMKNDINFTLTQQLSNILIAIGDNNELLVDTTTLKQVNVINECIENYCQEDNIGDTIMVPFFIREPLSIAIQNWIRLTLFAIEGLDIEESFEPMECIVDGYRLAKYLLSGE
jgi:hypothetical protein